MHGVIERRLCPDLVGPMRGAMLGFVLSLLSFPLFIDVSSYRPFVFAVLSPSPLVIPFPFSWIRSYLLFLLFGSFPYCFSLICSSLPLFTVAN